MLSLSNDAIPGAEDAVYKSVLVSEGWRAMFAGDPSSLPSLLRRVYRIAPQRGADTDAMQQAFREAYQDEMRQQIEDRFLSPYGWSLEKFRKEAFRGLGPAEFAKLNNEIRDFSLNLQFLVFGFDSGLARVFEVGNPGVVNSHDVAGYAVIGSGYYMAMGALAARPITRLPVEQVVCRLCEAKFTAETAHGVGRETTLTVLNSIGLESLLDESLIENLRQEWQRERRADVDVYKAQNIKEALLKGAR